MIFSNLSFNILIAFNSKSAIVNPAYLSSIQILNKSTSNSLCNIYKVSDSLRSITQNDFNAFLEHKFYPLLCEEDIADEPELIKWKYSNKMNVTLIEDKAKKKSF